MMILIILRINTMLSESLRPCCPHKCLCLERQDEWYSEQTEMLILIGELALD